VQEESPEGLADIQRFYFVLSPRGKDTYRLITVGRKRLPSIQGGERNWAYVSKVGRRPEEVEDELDREVYQTKTRGERVRPEGRPAGEGVYAIVKHGRHTHLAYELEFPKKPGDVQEELQIEVEASYVVSVANPERRAPPRAGVRSRRGVEFPRHLQERFRGRRFIELDPPDFLDHENTELLLVGAEEKAEEELDIQLDPEEESEAAASIFKDLKLERAQHPIEPLFRGEWR
jgi:hypothetical protein